MIISPWGSGRNIGDDDADEKMNERSISIDTDSVDVENK